MTRPRLLAVAAWLGTVVAVTGTAALALAVADLATVLTVALAALALVVGLLTAGTVVVALRPRLLAACARANPGGCAGCGLACRKAGASTG